jgi:hypothetical protein
MDWSSKTHLKVIKYKVFQNHCFSMWLLVMMGSRTAANETLDSIAQLCGPVSSSLCSQFDTNFSIRNPHGI